MLLITVINKKYKKFYIISQADQQFSHISIKMIIKQNYLSTKLSIESQNLWKLQNVCSVVSVKKVKFS